MRIVGPFFRSVPKYQPPPPKVNPATVTPTILTEAFLPLWKNRIPFSMFADRVSWKAIARQRGGYDGEVEKQI